MTKTGAKTKTGHTMPGSGPRYPGPGPVPQAWKPGLGPQVWAPAPSREPEYLRAGPKSGNRFRQPRTGPEEGNVHMKHRTRARHIKHRH